MREGLLEERGFVSEALDDEIFGIVAKHLYHRSRDCQFVRGYFAEEWSIPQGVQHLQYFHQMRTRTYRFRHGELDSPIDALNQIPNPPHPFVLL